MKKLTTAIVFLVIPVLVLAGPSRMKAGRKVTGAPMEMCKELNLTEEQQQKMHDLRVEHQKAVIPLLADIKLAKLDIEELVRKGDTSKKLDAAIKKVNNLRAKHFELQIRHRIEVGQILTDEQKAVWQKLQGHRGMMKAHPGMRGDRRYMMEEGPYMHHGQDND